jgi:hypothetical protein
MRDGDRDRTQWTSISRRASCRARSRRRQATGGPQAGERRAIVTTQVEGDGGWFIAVSETISLKEGVPARGLKGGRLYALPLS